jgi:hypothetical protein
MVAALSAAEAIRSDCDTLPNTEIDGTRSCSSVELVVMSY